VIESFDRRPDKPTIAEVAQLKSLLPPLLDAQARLRQLLR